MTTAPINPPVGYGDVTQVLLEHLRAGLAARGVTGLTSGSRYDADRPLDAPFLLVRRVGGSSPSLGVDVARMDVQVWHRTEVQAHDLAALVRALVHQARGVAQIRAVKETAGPVPIPDPDTGQPRYLMTADLTLRGDLL